MTFLFQLHSHWCRAIKRATPPQHTAQHVRTTAAFMPSSAPTSGRMGRLAGHIREKEFLAVYAQLSGLVQDDALFLEFLHHTCNPLPRVRSKREQLKRV